MEYTSDRHAASLDGRGNAPRGRIRCRPGALVSPYVFLYCLQRLTNGIRVRPEIHFAPDLLASKHPGLAQYPQMVRHCRPRERGRRNDLTNVKSLTRFEHQHDALSMRVTQRHKNAGDAPPSLWNCLAVGLDQDYMTSYVVTLL